MNKNNVSEELQVLWKMRDLAKGDKAIKKAQAKIDNYFLGGDEKKKRKPKQKKRYDQDDEWGY